MLLVRSVQWACQNGNACRHQWSKKVPTKRQLFRLTCLATLALLVVVVNVFSIIDVFAIMEHPDPVRTEFLSTKARINTTLIVMIETRSPLPKTVCINQDYARRHGYAFQVVSDHACYHKYRSIFLDEAYLWCRPLIFKDYLKQYESIFYLDSDAYFVNPNLSIESFFEYARQNDYYISNNDQLDQPGILKSFPLSMGIGNTTFVGAKDCGGYLANGGIQFWRNTPYTNKALTTWFLLYRRQFPYYFLRQRFLRWSPSNQNSHFEKLEQGSFKAAVLENKWLEHETSLIRYGSTTWHVAWESRNCMNPPMEDTFYLNHMTGNFGEDVRREWPLRHIELHNITCQSG